MKLKNLFTLFLGGCALQASAQTIVGTTPTPRNVVLEELTGTNCTYCPDGHLRAQQLSDANPGRVVLVNLHAGSFAGNSPDYKIAYSNYVDALFPVTGYPTGSVNRRVMPNPTQQNANNTSVMTSRGVWAQNAATVFAETSEVNVGADGTIDLDNGSLSLNVEAYYTAAGPGTSNKMNVLLLQNNVPGPQTGASFNPGAILPNGDYNHMHMARYSLTGNAGDNIDSIAATDLYTNTYTYTIPAAISGITANKADLEIAVYVSEAATTGTVLSGSKASLAFNTATPLGISNQAATVNASLGTVCGTSADVEMLITNMGNAALTTATFEYVVNGGTPGTYQHTFSTALPTAQYETVTIPVSGLSPNGASNSINVSVTQLNGSANPGSNATNGLSATTAGMQSASTATATINLTTDNYGSETSWELVNETTGVIVASGSGYTNNQTITPVTVNLVDGNCYKFIIEDTYGDGICCAYGNGSFSFSAGSTTFSSGGNFTTEDGIKFVFDQLTGVSMLGESADAIKVMPNPVSNNMTLEFTVAEMADLNITVLNGLGQTIKQVANGSYEGVNVIDVQTSDLSSGVYFVNITSAKGTSTKRFIVKK